MSDPRFPRLPIGDIARRALEETLADGAHEMRADRGLGRRLTGAAVTGMAIARLAASAFSVFDEGHPMLSLGQDLRAAVRRLTATPVFSVFAVITLALGIGATTAIYSAVHAFVGPPPGVGHVDRLVNVTHSEWGSIPMMALSYGDFEDLRAQQTVFQSVAGWAFFRQSFAANGQADTAFGEVVTGDYFNVLEVPPALGRTIQPSDDVPGAPAVAVISHGVWQRMFGGAADVIGKTVKMNGVGLEIVGVAPKTFAGLFNGGLVASAMWVPMASIGPTVAPGMGLSLDTNDRERRWVQVRARLKPDASLAQARANIAGIAAALDRVYPIGQRSEPQFRQPYNVSRPWLVRPTTEVLINETATHAGVSTLAATFMAAVGLVLLVACTNLANLMLARGADRRAELAVRLALGASRWRLVRVVFAECLLLTAIGGFAGVVLARWLALSLGQDFAIDTGTTLHVVMPLDPAVVGVAGAATLAAVVVGGLFPAIQATRGDLRGALSAGASQAALPRWRGRRFMIAMQVAVSVLLVSVAALCITQLSRGRRDTGIDLEHIALADVDFTTQRYPTARTREIVAAVLDQFAQRPHVVGVAASSGWPVSLTNPGVTVGVAGPPTNYGELVAATPGIFDTLGVTVTRGRGFNARDGAGAPLVAVISEETAKKLFSRAEVVGEAIVFKRRQWAGEPEPPVQSLRIVGVASDTDTGAPGLHGYAVVYVPLDQQPEGRLVIAVRTTDDPAALVAPLRQSLSVIDHDLAVTRAGTGLAIAAPPNAFLQWTAGVGGVLGTFALLLALTGLYGALSHVVARRTREIGLRLALGAARQDIVRMVVGDGVRPVLSGLVAGLIIGGIVRMAAQPLFEKLLPAIDPLVVTIVPIAMGLAAAVACYLPARRAARVDPNVALREP